MKRAKRAVHRAVGVDEPPAPASVIEGRVDAEIRAADADLQRTIAAKNADLELKEKERLSRELAHDRRVRREQRAARLRRTTRKRQRALKWRAWRELRASLRLQFEQALAGRLILLLVAMAAATAWYGQYRYLHEVMNLAHPFPAAGATALELLGLGMFSIARSARRYRDRAIRARLVGWAVIGFSAFSNWVHNGVLLAALSVAGPVAWEIHEWWQQRVVLHDDGKLPVRPVRPRFPIDQVVLFPLWTYSAYRIAVRDRIEDVGQALAIAARERAAQRWLNRSTRRSWAKSVRRSIDRHEASIEHRSDRLVRLPLADRSEPGSMSIEVVPIDIRRITNDRLAEREPGSSDCQVVKTPAKPRRLRRVFTRTGRPRELRLGPLIVDEIDSNDHQAATGIATGRATDRPASQRKPGRFPAGKSGLDVVGKTLGDGDLQGNSDEGKESSVRSSRSPDQSHDRTPDTRSSYRTLEQLRVEAHALVEREGWLPRDVKAIWLQKRLRCSPNRARILRNEINALPDQTRDVDSEG
ncbi:hypothetical protein CFP71_13345 [Amycolatopsis thailandensis]|uniref:DUF2637 domain-containing protein n=1 Tax=Amycolatopsis thailandensis TaxID=589330 RepID=A0A229SBY2_9PSEU|nr:DUF2637 domain-containing protein [Amycolatopsis thailandensis]OXM56408.1 hypothetical protein CFP71_13345 [Amycolatopsis thailandensis]